MIKFKPTENQVINYYTSSLTAEELKENLDVYLSLALKAFAIVDHVNLFQFLQEDYLEEYLQVELSNRVSELEVLGTRCVIKNNGTRLYNQGRLSMSLLVALLSLPESKPSVFSFKEFSFLEEKSVREIMEHYGYTVEDMFPIGSLRETLYINGGINE